MVSIRRCKHKGCGALLSKYNPAPVCYHHPEHPRNHNRVNDEPGSTTKKAMGTGKQKVDHAHPVQDFSGVGND